MPLRLVDGTSAARRVSPTQTHQSWTDNSFHPAPSLFQLCQSALFDTNKPQTGPFPPGGALNGLKSLTVKVVAFFLFFSFFLILSFAADHLFGRWRQTTLMSDCRVEACVARRRLQKESGIQREAKLEQRAAGDLSCLFCFFLLRVWLFFFFFLFNFHFSV